MQVHIYLSHIKKKFITILLLLSLLGCASNSFPPAPKNVDRSSELAEYRLGALDSIQIFVWRSPELSTSVSIRPDGKISIPLIEDLEAAGKTSTELAREIENILGAYVKDPLVTVIVGGFTGDLKQQVRIIGQSQKPQSIPYRSGMTILDAMITVGGLLEFADGNNATLTRGSGDKRVTYSLRLDDLIRDGDIGADVPVQPGDVIIIPESQF
ncbi:MAG: polysaccharide export outer membrane protein [Alphaproteobacteria bacterium]|jgi:polysaccharide export outer membrane protein